MINAISSSNAWQALNLTKQGTLGFLTTPANNIIKNNKPPKGKDLSIIATGNVSNKSTFKTENLYNKQDPKGNEAFNGKVYKITEVARWII